MASKKYTLDKGNLIKIGKGALIAGAGAAALFLLNALGALELTNPMLTGFVAWFVPVATNAIKEFLKDD